MNLPRGRLLRSRVVDDPGTVLDAALSRTLTGYVVFEPGDALLFDDATRGVMTFEAGVPVLAYDAATDRGGPDALSALAGPGPYRVELYELPPDELAAVHETSTLRVPPDLPADRLAADVGLVARTREAAPDDRLSAEPSHTSAVEAFLADETAVEAIRQEARAEARRRADEWGLSDALADDSDGDGDSDGGGPGDVADDAAPAPD
jgi:hypothetical protein